MTLPKGKSVCQSLSALCTTSLENVSAISGLHSLSETVLLLSLTLFRLISSKHVWHLLADSFGSVSSHSRHFRFYTMTSYIINTKRPNCQVFFENFKRFFTFFTIFPSKYPRIAVPRRHPADAGSFYTTKRAGKPRLQRSTSALRSGTPTRSP